MDGYEFDQHVALVFNQTGDSLLPGIEQESDYGQQPILLAGVDEVGRGPLAGPLVAAAVMLPFSPRLVGLRDSKTVPQEQREALYCEIFEHALSIGVSVVEAPMIDELNILGATMKAMREAIQKLTRKPNYILIDGNQKPKCGYPERAVIKGDNKSASIMAASIVAKVTRDHIMIDLHEKFPAYGFDENKGYGSQKHLEALKNHGPSPVHRNSFEPVKSLLQPITPLL